MTKRKTVNPVKWWNVDFTTATSEGWDKGREIHVEVTAKTSREAMMIALFGLELDNDEILHTLDAHIGIPYEVS